MAKKFINAQIFKKSKFYSIKDFKLMLLFNKIINTILIFSDEING